MKENTMKKLLQIVTLATVALFLTACSPSLDGTYNATDDSGADFTLTIKEKNVKFKAEAFLFNIKMKGKLDPSKKQMNLKGSFLGSESKETFSYEVKNGDIILDMDGESLTFEKENE